MEMEIDMPAKSSAPFLVDFSFSTPLRAHARFPRHDFTLRASPNGRSEAGFGRDNAAVVEGSHGVT
jgi:hypothetical protein